MKMNKKNGLVFGAILVTLMMFNGAADSTTTMTMMGHEFKVTDKQCIKHIEKAIQLENTNWERNPIESLTQFGILVKEGQVECKNNTEAFKYFNFMEDYAEGEINKIKLAKYEAEAKKDKAELAAIRAERSGEGTRHQQYQNDEISGVYTVSELFSIVKFSNTDLKNKRLSKELIANRTIVTDQCQVTEVDYSGSEYEINCRLPGRKQFLTLYSNSDDVENIGRGQTIRFEGTIESLDAKNDWLDMQILKVNIRSWS